MLKHTIKYEDFNGEEQIDLFYFNISKSEFIEMEVDYPGGFQNTIKTIVDQKDVKGLVKEFKKLILFAYGQKSEDGKRFIKSEKLSEEFSQTAAFQTLFMQLATDETVASNFINGLVPADLVPDSAKPNAALPPPPSVVTEL
jgi:hypothetical protein